MRRGGTLLVVIAIAAIAIVALADSLRGDGGAESAAPQERAAGTTTEAADPPEPEEEISGTLYYTDETCTLEAVRLPSLRSVEAPNWTRCRFVLSPDGIRVGADGSGWDPHADPRRGRVFQSEDGKVRVGTNAGPEGEPFRGTAPAWRPDGTLTYFANGAIRDWPEGRTIVPAHRLRMVVSEVPNPPDEVALVRRVRVVEHHWLDQDRLVAVLRAHGRDGLALDVVAVFDEGLPFAATNFFGEVRDLWGSPFGTYFAVLADSLRLYDRNANSLFLPGFEGGRAVAWSPDERKMAVATDASVYVFTPGQIDEVERFALVANDLDWRGRGSPEGLAEADDARGWLGPTGASGRLVVSIPEEDGCTLHALRIPDLTWAEQPSGIRGPCRFTLGPGDEVFPDDELPQPGGDRVAVCRDHAVDVLEEGELFAGYPGACAPAWMPDGTLTFIRDGELFHTVADVERRLMSRQRLSELLGRPSALEEIAWVRDDQFWAAVRSGESATLALLTTGQLAMSPSFTARMIERLRVSSTGIVAAETDRGVVFFDNGGRRALTFPNGRAVTWAPDQVIAAMATPQTILLVAPISGEVVSLPLAVRDLEWVVP
jgi:hypothetical protein